MKNSTILRVLLLGVVALSGIIAMQSYWVVSTWNINEEEFNKKVNLALYNVAKSMADLNNGTLPARDVVKRRTTNYYIVNIENEIDEEHLEYFLQREFEKMALNIDFEYAVFDCYTNEMIYGNFVRYDPIEKHDLNLGDLPKDNEFTYYFGVKFPSRSGYLFGKMQLSIFFSAILLVTMIFFAYSMFVILRQKRLSEMQKDFINNMTHEFKTPISTIKIAADTFLSNPDIQANPRLFQYANLINEQNQRLNNQVEKVLQLARIERSNYELKLEEVDLCTLVREVAQGIAVHVEEAGGKLQLDCPPANAMVRADKLHLTNIIHNLLDNAVKYCRQTPDINLHINLSAQTAQLVVSDKGIGIPKEYQSSIFDKFYRVPTGNVHNVKGFGLGLYYVKNVCDAHNWKIKLTSESGKGTTVAILMPLLKPLTQPSKSDDITIPSPAVKLH